MKRPVSYKNWREVWHREAKELGWHVAARGASGQPINDRETWNSIRRLKRIRDRLDIENQVMDRSWCETSEKLFRNYPNLKKL